MNHKALLLLSVVLTLVPPNAGYLDLHLMTDKVDSGAMCLDGSPAGFNIRRAANGSAHRNDWMLFFEGGGWCYNEEDCYLRSLTYIGSSVDWADAAVQEGVASEDCKVSPFCGFNHVYMRYCDGTSFSSDLEEPLVYNDTNLLHFRGKRNLEAVLETITEQYGFHEAEHILLSGCSAGGMSAYLHSNAIEAYSRAVAPKLTTFKTAPCSGMFLDYQNEAGVHVWANEISHIVELTNMTSGFDAGCVAEHGWRCVFPLVAYQYITAPVFVMNSAVDLYSSLCMFVVSMPPNFPNPPASYYPIGQTCFSASTAEAGVGGEVASCAYGKGCSNAKDPLLVWYLNFFVASLTNTSKVHSSQNGAYIDTCLTHCGASLEAFPYISFGSTSLKSALTDWWNEVEGDHIYVNHDLGKGSCHDEGESMWKRVWQFVVIGVSVASAVVAAGVMLWRGRGEKETLQAPIERPPARTANENDDSGSTDDEEEYLLCSMQGSSACISSAARTPASTHLTPEGQHLTPNEARDAAKKYREHNPKRTNNILV